MQDKTKQIKSKLASFKSLSEKQKFQEFMFCLLTPQSNAQKCWQAVEEISKLPSLNQKNVSQILSKKTRFHNTKTKRIIEAFDNWQNIRQFLGNNNVRELRNWLAENVKGIGLKEASHFLRNIGKSNNQVAILDRHILKNLKEIKIIKDEKIKNKKDYFEKEKKFIEFSEKIGIPLDELDLLFWSKENGEIFK